MAQPIQFTAKTALQAKAQRPARITIAAYNGDAMRPHGVDGEVVISLDGIRAIGKIPLLLDHRNEVDAIVGYGDATVENGGLVIAGELADSQAARAVVAIVQSGGELKASVGGSIVKTQFIEGGNTVAVNGRDVVATADGLLLVTQFSLNEVSVVPIAADQSTSIRVAANRRRNRAMSDDFQSFVSMALPNASLADMTHTEIAKLHANFSGRTDATPEDFEAVDTHITATADDPAEAESRRLRQIDRVTKGDWGPSSERIGELRASAIGGDIDVDALIGKVQKIRAERAYDNMPVARGPIAPQHALRGDRGRGGTEIIEAALLCKSGHDKLAEETYGERVMYAADKLRNHSLVDIARQTMILAGDADGHRLSTNEVVHRTLTAGASSTYSLPTALGNSLNKVVEAFFRQGPATTCRICRVWWPSVCHFREEKPPLAAQNHNHGGGMKGGHDNQKKPCRRLLLRCTRRFHACTRLGQCCTAICVTRRNGLMRLSSHPTFACVLRPTGAFSQ